jgi:hypothetical protein
MHFQQSKIQSSKTSLLIGFAFALLSIAAHLAFVGWVGGVLESSALNPALRDTPIEVSLRNRSVTAPNNELNSEPIPQPISNPISRPKPRRPRIVSNAVTNATSAMPSDAPSAPSIPSTPSSSDGATLTSDKRLLEPAVDNTKQPSTDEPSVELAKDKPVSDKPVAEVPLYTGGLGNIPVAGAFPYTFYLGDYTQNNQLGAGSFIVESEEGKYKLVLIAKASGLTSLIFSGVTYRSEGLFGVDGFAPQLYAEKTGNRPERAAQVDYVAQEVSLGEQKKPALRGMQDRVSVIWQVGLVLRAKPEFAERGKMLPIPLMSTRSLDNAQFVSQGIVDFDKRGAVVKAVHFKFVPANPANKAQIDLWYDLSNLPQPLRVRWIDERDRTYDIFRDD